MCRQVIVTDAGPSREVCPAAFQGCLFVAADEAECRIKPCGAMSLFGERTVSQPSWAEPRPEALQARLQQAYLNRRAAGALRARLVAYAASQTWYDVGTLMLERVQALLRRKASALAADRT